MYTMAVKCNVFLIILRFYHGIMMVLQENIDYYYKSNSNRNIFGHYRRDQRQTYDSKHFAHYMCIANYFFLFEHQGHVWGSPMIP